MATANFKLHARTIDTNFVNWAYTKYMQGLWGIEVGYRVYSWCKVFMEKWLLTWQLETDCEGILCDQSRKNNSIIIQYPKLGKNPFPQIFEANDCYIPGRGFGIPAVPQNIIINNESLSITQFEVDTTGGPISNTNQFTPIVAGSAYLIGRKMDMALGVLLTKGSDYVFNITTGTITLLQGRLFNSDEVYTIFTY